jgi:hypothetical protein
MGVVGSERSPTCSTGNLASRQSCEDIHFHDAWIKHAAEESKSVRCQEDLIVLFGHTRRILTEAGSPRGVDFHRKSWRRYG